MTEKITLLILAALASLSFISCDDIETYAEQKDKERDAISAYIAEKGIKVISEQEFLNNDTTTDVSKNEYVLFGTTGVYMQIVNRGCGHVLQKDESVTVLARFEEYNILEGYASLGNINSYYHTSPEKFDIRNVSGSFYASFVAESSLIYSTYNYLTVPPGWLVPFSYIKIGRPTKEDEDIAHVRLIVPHDQGHSGATAGVYPCYYDITFQKGI